MVGIEICAEKRLTTLIWNMTNFDKRHHIVVNAYEEGKLGIDDYLKLVIFHKERSFEFNAFKEFLFAQTQ